MKFCVVGPLPPLRGGISHYNTSLLNSLKERGHDLLAVNYQKLYPDFLFPGTSQLELTNEIYPGSKSILLAWSTFTWIKTLNEIKKFKPEVLVVHHWHPFFVPCLTTLFKSISKIEKIIIAHNVLPHESKSYAKILNSFLFKEADKIIVGAGSEKEILLDQFNYKGKCEVVPHPVYNRFCQEENKISQEEAKIKLGYKAGDPLFINLGLIRHYKGVDVFIKSIPLVKNAQANFEIAGEFYDEEKKSFDLASSLGLLNRLKIINQYQSDEDISLRLTAADAVVLPYRSATQSGIAMAALACGVPVIATRVGALRDVIDSEIMGTLVNPENHQELAEAMDRFIQKPVAQRSENRSEIARIANNRYSWESLARKLETES